MGFSTDCIHAGQEPDPSTGAIITPIFQTSTYVQQGIGQHKGYEYARTQNPTRRALEKNLAALEGGADAYCYASGMAATQAVLSLIKQGQRVVVSDNVYGGTHRLFTKVLAHYGIDFAFIDASDPAAFAKAAGRLDLVVHSTTKFLNGHSDSVGGVVVVKDAKLANWLQFYQNAAGAILSPMDSWLVLRGTKTLALRMPRHEENSRVVAEFLRGQSKVKHVYWPGFEDHPGHAVQKKQASGFGALISFDLGSREAADRLLRGVSLCSLGESLGGIETLISHPATMTHAGYTQPERDALGIGNGLVRISVGCEDAEDLLADLRKGLEAV
jgi:cystathionine beta-lyase